MNANKFCVVVSEIKQEFIPRSAVRVYHPIAPLEESRPMIHFNRIRRQLHSEPDRKWTIAALVLRSKLRQIESRMADIHPHNLLQFRTVSRIGCRGCVVVRLQHGIPVWLRSDGRYDYSFKRATVLSDDDPRLLVLPPLTYPLDFEALSRYSAIDGRPNADSIRHAMRTKTK